MQTAKAGTEASEQVLGALESKQIIKLREEDTDRRTVLFDDWTGEGENEMVLFLKPELVVLSEDALGKILAMVFEALRRFRFRVESVIFLPSMYLKKFSIMDEHYGVINKLARAATSSMSEAARNRFKSVYGADVEGSDVVGGFEFLDRFPKINAESLDRIWGAERSEKLAPGTYCRRLNFDGTDIFLINGFHPSQLLHYTEPLRGILVIVLRSDTRWSIARKSLVGATRPEDAEEGSLRSLLLARREELGISEISQAFNGVHLSAGPVEALTELRRFVSDLSTGRGQLPTEEFSFGKQLIEAFGDEKTEYLLSNPNADVKGKNVSVFDLSEELDSGEAVRRLREIDF